MTTQRNNDWVKSASAEEIDRAYSAGELDNLLNRPPTANYGDGSQTVVDPLVMPEASEITGPATTIPAGTSPARQLAGLLASIEATVADPAAREVMKRAASSLTNYGALSKPEEVTGPTWDSK